MKIENSTGLQNGAPLEFTADGDGFEAGRDQAMDWWLPDDTRFISSRHFEVSYRGGVYYMTDLSSNGTYKLGETNRIVSPLQLYGGEKFQIGEYIVVAELDTGAQVEADPFGAAPVSHDSADPWSVGGGAPPPVAISDVVPDTPRASFDDEFIQNDIPAAAPAFPDPSPPSAGLGVPTPAQAPPPPPPAFGAPATPSPPPAPAFGSPSGAAPSGDAAAVLAAFCQGAGIPATASQDPVAVAQELGRSMRIVTEGIMALLQARAQAKTFVKSSSRTMMSFDANNPMKFLPDAAQALDAMFLNKRQGFMDGTAGFEDAMKDIKAHQAGVYAAIQPALAQLLEDISPEAIEARVEKGMLGTKRGAKWDTFVERWDAKTEHHENGMLDVFLAYFADAYDKASSNQE